MTITSVKKIKVEVDDILWDLIFYRTLKPEQVLYKNEEVKRVEEAVETIREFIFALGEAGVIEFEKP